MKSSKTDSESRVRVLLVDQDAAFGRRLAQVLEGQGKYRLCDHVLDVAAAQVAMVNDSPDLVVAGTDPDSTNSFHLLCSLVATRPERWILAASRRCDPGEAEQVLLAGARGLLLKTEPSEEILNAFTTVLKGQIYVSRAVTMPLLKRLLKKPSGAAASGVESFTDRELRVFELLGAGLSTREIATRLGLSCKTVETHREKIKHRLGVEGAAALAQSACAWVQRGLRAGGASPADGSSGGAGTAGSRNDGKSLR